MSDRIVFSDAPMEGPPGGLTRNGVFLPMESELMTYYYQTCEDGPWHESDAFLEYLEELGFTHVEVTWEGDSAKYRRLSDWRSE